MSDTPAVPARPVSRQLGLSITVTPVGPQREGDEVLVLTGELKARNSYAAADALARAISEVQGRRLVLDLTGIEFCDLSSVQMLDNARRVLAEADRELVLRNPPSSMRELLQILELEDHFVIESDAR